LGLNGGGAYTAGSVTRGATVGCIGAIGCVGAMAGAMAGSRVGVRVGEVREYPKAPSMVSIS
jgi:hypothetical protein